MIHNIQLFQNVDWDTSVKAYVNSSPPKDIWTETNCFIIFNVLHSPILYRGRRGRYLMVVRFTITYAMSAYHH